MNPMTAKIINPLNAMTRTGMLHLLSGIASRRGAPGAVTKVTMSRQDQFVSAVSRGTAQ